MNHPSMDVLFPLYERYDPSENFIIYVTDEAREEMTLCLIRCGCVKPDEGNLPGG